VLLITEHVNTSLGITNNSTGAVQLGCAATTQDTVVAYRHGEKEILHVHWTDDDFHVSIAPSGRCGCGFQRFDYALKWSLGGSDQRVAAPEVKEKVVGSVMTQKL